MTRWRVEYEIDFDEGDGVTTPLDAARAVFDMLREPASYAPVFTVTNVDTGEQETIDLEEDDGE